MHQQAYVLLPHVLKSIFTMKLMHTAIQQQHVYSASVSWQGSVLYRVAHLFRNLKPECNFCRAWIHLSVRIGEGGGYIRAGSVQILCLRPVRLFEMILPICFGWLAVCICQVTSTCYTCWSSGCVWPPNRSWCIVLELFDIHRTVWELIMCCVGAT